MNTISQLHIISQYQSELLAWTFLDSLTVSLSRGIYCRPVLKCHKCVYCKKQFRCHILAALVHLLEDPPLSQIESLHGGKLEGDEKGEGGWMGALNQRVTPEVVHSNT